MICVCPNSKNIELLLLISPIIVFAMVCFSECFIDDLANSFFVQGHTVQAIKISKLSTQLKSVTGGCFLPQFKFFQVPSEKLDRLAHYMGETTGSYYHKKVKVYFIDCDSCEKNDVSKAERYLEEALSLQKKANFIEAEELNRAAILRDKYLAPAWTNLAICIAVNQGDIEESIFAIRNSIKFSKGKHKASSYYVLALIERGWFRDIDSANRNFEMCLKYDPNFQLGA